MQESIKAILAIFTNMGFKAYYTGKKCRNDYYGAIHKEALNRTMDIRIVTNASPENIIKIFPHAIQHEENKMIFDVEFANAKFVLESFHKQTYYFEKEENGKTVEEFLSIPVVEAVNSIEEDFERKVFNVECIAMNEDGFAFAKKTEEDIKSKTIRTIKGTKDVFYHYPVRCLQAFALMAETGFDIDKQVLKDIKSTMRYMRFMPSEQIGVELRNVMRGKFALKALRAMHKIGILNSRCLVQKGEEQEKEKILFSLHSSDISKFDIISKFRVNNDVELELWALMFDDAKTATEELEKFHCFSEEEFKTILWLINNKHIVKKADDIQLRNDIYNSLGSFEKTQGIHHLKKLILHANHIFKVVDDNYSKEEKNEIANKMLYNICCRPYFVNQLTWKISQADKEMLIEKLLNEKVYPFEEKDIDAFLDKYNCKKLGDK